MNEVKNISIKQKIDLFMCKIRPEWTTLEKAKYIYINLAKVYSFDNDYTWGDKETKQKLLDRAKSLTSFDDDLVNQKYQICISLSKIYILLLNQVGIDAREVPGKKDHVYVEIKNEDGQYFTADLQKDLPNIQTNSKTEYFAPRISSDKQLQIDKNIEYITSQRKYTDEYMEEILDCFLDCYCENMQNFKESINDIFEKMSKILDPNNMIGANNQYMDQTEKYLYYSNLFSLMLSGDFKMYYIPESESKLIMSIRKPDGIFLFFKSQGNSFVGIPRDELEKIMEDKKLLSEEGLYID